MINSLNKKPLWSVSIVFSEFLLYKITWLGLWITWVYIDHKTSNLFPSWDSYMWLLFWPLLLLLKWNFLKWTLAVIFSFDNLMYQISEALFEITLPRFSGDILPKTDAGTVLAVADRQVETMFVFSFFLSVTLIKKCFSFLCRILYTNEICFLWGFLTKKAASIWINPPPKMA